MIRKQYQLFCYSGTILRRLRYGLLAMLIALTQILNGAVSIQAATPADLVQQGKIAYEQGIFPTALTIWQQAETAYSQTNDTEGVAGSRLNQVQALVAMGMHRRACKTLTSTVQINENVCDDTLPEKFGIRQSKLPLSLQTLTLSTLGDVLRLLGNLDAAQLTLAQAEEISQPLTASIRAQVLVNIANTLRDLGNRDRDRTDRLQPPAKAAIVCSAQSSSDLKAAAYYQQAIACYHQAGNLNAHLNNLSLLVETSQWLRQHHNESDRMWQQQFNQSELVEQINRQLPNQPFSYEGLNQRIHFAQTLSKMNSPQWQSAQALLSTVITQARSHKQTAVLANALGTLGWLYEQNQQWTEAMQWTQQALALATIAPTTSNDTLYQWEWQLARILQHQSQPDLGRSKAAYERALADLERTRGNIRVINPDAQFSLRDSVEPLYRELVDLSFRLPAPDLPQIITQIDALKLAELENFLECQLGEYRSVDRFAEDSGAAVFYPVILDDRLEVIIKLAQNKFQRFVVPVSRSQIETVVASFNQNLTQPQYGWDDAPAAQLYDWLIRPAQKYLTPRTKKLVFVMDGVLQNIPVAALFDRQNREFLIDRYPVSVTPGLKILGAKQSLGNKSQILIGGLTSTTSIASDRKRGVTYEPLSFAANEVRVIKSLFPLSAELVGKNFTEDNIRRVLASGTYSMIHLATHGQFSSDPRQTFVLTDAGQSIDLNSLRSILKQGRSQAIDLIVLSACETATGDRRAALGLAGVAIRSGAASTLASLWSVDDAATAALMQKFYGALTQQEGIGKAEALQSAQKEIRHQYEHPYYWASFVLVGNWL